MNDPSSNDVFISYASADLRFAEEVHRRLADAGFKVWFDKARLRPGCDWHEEIETRCEASPGKPRACASCQCVDTNRPV